MVGGAVRAAGGGGSRSGIIEGATALLGSLRGHASKTPSRPKIRNIPTGIYPLPFSSFFRYIK